MFVAARKPTSGLVSSKLAGRGSFSPVQLGNCILWLKSDLLTLADGNTITAWSDLSGTGSHVTFSNTPTFKVGIINNLPVIRFNGTSNIGLASLAGNKTPTSMFIAYANRSAVNGTFLGSNSGANVLIQRNTVLAQDSVVGGITCPDLNVHNILTMIYDYTNNQYSAYVDGVLAQAITTASTNNISSYSIGARGSGGSEFLAGDIIEIIVYHRILLASERHQVENYLAKRIGKVVA